MAMPLATRHVAAHHKQQKYTVCVYVCFSCVNCATDLFER